MKLKQFLNEEKEETKIVLNNKKARVSIYVELKKLNEERKNYIDLSPVSPDEYCLSFYGQLDGITYSSIFHWEAVPEEIKNNKIFKKFSEWDDKYNRNKYKHEYATKKQEDLLKENGLENVDYLKQRAFLKKHNLYDDRGHIFHSNEELFQVIPKNVISEIKKIIKDN